MKDLRIDKVKKHFDLFFDNKKFKVISCKSNEADKTLSIKTKIFGQDFPHNGHFAIAIPSQNASLELSVSLRYMGKGASVEHWEYTIKAE